MQMDLSEIAEFDKLIGHLEDTSVSLGELYIHIDDYDRNQAAAKIATYAGLVQGVTTRLKELRG